MTFEHSHKPPKRNLEIPQELIVRMWPSWKRFCTLFKANIKSFVNVQIYFSFIGTCKITNMKINIYYQVKYIKI